MTRKRGAGQGPEVIKAQHFDSHVSLVRRVAQKFARFSGIGGSFFDPQIVTGTIGNMAGAFLMQLVASPVTRPAFAHLWSYGIPAIHNGDGTATPCLDAWANKDTDIGALTVDVGTQSVSAGDFGIIHRGSEDDSQALLFAKVGGGAGAGGGTDWFWGDASDGDLTLDGTTAAFIQETTSPGYALTQLGTSQGVYGGVDPVHAGQNAGNYTNGVKTYNQWRGLFFNHLHLASGVKLFTQGYPLFARKITSDDNTAEITMSVPVWAAMPFDGFNTIDGSCSPGGNSGIGANGSQAAQATTVRVPLALQTGSQFGSYANAGAGGNSNSHTGGAARTALGGIALSSIRTFGALMRANQGINFGAGLGAGIGVTTWAGGQGGSGGASDSGGGGTGGRSGGIVLVNAQDLSGYLGKFSAKGGDGGTPSNDGRSAGGGGAGSGGFLSVNTDTSKTPSKVWSTSDIGPGTPGSGVGTGGTSGGTSSSGLSIGTYP